MTAQFPERLLYEEQDLSLCDTPLSTYFALRGVAPDFIATCSALWRGYVGTWEIVGHRLYLIGLEGTLADGRAASLATLFPDHPQRVFAHWYTGSLRVPQGRQIEYVHAGYASRFERDLLFDVERGVVKQVRVRHNGTAPDPAAPEGYAPGAWTVISPPRGTP